MSAPQGGAPDGGALARERRFWDAQAGARDLQALRREARFLGEERLFAWLRAEVASLRPRRLLDAGCGRGVISVMLRGEAPLVVGVDVAVSGLEAGAAYARAEGAGAGVQFVAGALEALPLRDGAVDAAAGRFVLHHAHDLDAAARELHRVLRAGGRAVFVETWGRNPLLRLGRDAAQLLGIGLGTPDERPLDAEAIATLRRRFKVELVFPHFTAFELANRALRRTRRLYVRSAAVRRAVVALWTRAIALDRWIERRLPWARPFGWFVALRLERSDDPCLGGGHDASV